MTRLCVALKIARSASWARMVPDFPDDAPMSATGFWHSTLRRGGIDAQSMAFFKNPGMEKLYSGDAIRSASAAAMASIRRATGGSRAGSRSALYGGSSATSNGRISIPAGQTSIAARSSPRLTDCFRRLPAIPQTRNRSFTMLCRKRLKERA